MNNILNPNSNIIPYSIDLLFSKNINDKTKEFKNNRKKFSLENAISILSKEKQKRTKQEITILCKFLSDNYEYFKKIKDLGELNKLEKLVSVLDFWVFKKNNVIIKYGDIGDKFYVLLKGSVGVYKPIYIKKTMSVWDFFNLLLDIKNKYNDISKYERIIKKNSFIGLDYDILINLSSEHELMKQEYNFIIEEEELMGIFNSGFAFGEIALIKRTTRNATIKAKEKSFCVSLDKHDYNKIIGELEEKRLERVLFKFQINYSLFHLWGPNQLLHLLNCLSIKKLNKGDFLYKQNEDSNCIYIIEEGSFEIYSMISFGWIQEFLSYILDSKNNLVNILYKSGELQENELIDLYNNVIKKKENSPCISDPFKSMKITVSNRKSNSLSEIKNKEKEFNNPFSLYKIFIRKIENKDIIGIEDSLELKQRFCYAKCISVNAVIKKVSLFDMFKLINLSIEDQIKLSLMDFISERKTILYDKINNFINQKKHFLMKTLDLDYEKYLEDKSIEDKIITLKFREKNPFEYDLNPDIENNKINKKNNTPIKKYKIKNKDNYSISFYKSLSNLNLFSIKSIQGFKKKIDFSKFKKIKINKEEDLNSTERNNKKPLTSRVIKSKKFIKTITNFHSISNLSNSNSISTNEKFSLDYSLFTPRNICEYNGFYSPISYKKKNNILPFVAKNKEKKKLLRSNIERKKFMNIIKNQIEETKKQKIETLEDNKIKKKYLDLSQIILNKKVYLKNNFKDLYNNEISLNKRKPIFYIDK